MYRKQLDIYTVASCVADVEIKPSKAQGQRRRNEKLAALAKAKEHGKEDSASPQYELRTLLGCRL